MQTYYLAVDIGASSGRHILGHLENGRLILEEIYRFDNFQVFHNGHDCWDIAALKKNLLAGMRACFQSGKIPSAMGIDTWAVDFVLTDKNGTPVSDAVAYRDKRTEGMDALAETFVSAERLYERTGIQKLCFNTLYQLLALQREHPEQLQQAEHFLMIPEYLNFCLTGVMKNEYTNATSTNLVNAREKTWDKELIQAYRLPEKLFRELSVPGETVGYLSKEVQQQVGFNCRVLLPATHDTGSAFLAVPAEGENAVYLSSGTWSLLGVENREPITTEASRKANFTNEGGAFYRFRYLKNIMGLWMIQSIRRELNGVDYVHRDKNTKSVQPVWGFQDLIRAAQEAEGFASLVDVDDESFLAPDSMSEAVRAYCRKTGQPEPASVGQLMQCVYRSLSRRYAQAIQELTALTGKTYTCIHIVGGGCQDQYLNQLTAQESGLPVLAGPVEGTALGNLAIQMIAAGEFKDLAAARCAIRKSFDIRCFKPQ